MLDTAEHFVVGQFVEVYIGNQWRKGRIERIRKEPCDNPVRVAITKTGHCFNVGTEDIRLDTVLNQHLLQEFSQEMEPDQPVARKVCTMEYLLYNY